MTENRGLLFAFLFLLVIMLIVSFTMAVSAFDTVHQPRPYLKPNPADLCQHRCSPHEACVWHRISKRKAWKCMDVSK